MSNKTAIAMSGGVDSSVAASLLLNMGHEIHGVTLKLHGDADKDAAAVAKKLGFTHEILDYSEDFNRYVVSAFVKSYENGETPNPCIECNKHIKFGRLIDEMKARGFDHVATGHYAIIEKQGDRFLLKKAVNQAKDQSYVLWGLTQEQLSMSLFPLGTYSKEEARELAAESGLVNAEKKDSQDICFVPDGDYGRFIEEYIGHKFPAGDFVDTAGKILGTHKGLIHYTIGQRKGLGLAMCHPVYVKEKDTANNRVVIADDEELFSKSLDARDVNIIAEDGFTGPRKLKARIRYKHVEKPAVVEMTGENTMHIEFDEPVRAIAPGQSVVLYDDDYVFGGGIIC